jgi:RNA polymerase sigma-70 factor, ECF subfamily
MAAETTASDEALMLRYRDGEASAFESLYRRHKGALYRYLVRQCRNAATAEELFQDIWMRLIAARNSYTVTARFTTYLYRIAHNRLVDHYRRDSVRDMVSYDDEGAPELAEPAAPASQQPDALLETREQAARLMAALDVLPAAQREAFVLQQEADLSLDEIAAATGVPRETAKSRLRYAMSSLRRSLGAGAAEPNL